MNVFESLVAINIKNHTVELTGMAYSQEFDNIFPLVVESQSSVIVHEIKTGLF